MKRFVPILLLVSAYVPTLSKSNPTRLPISQDRVLLESDAIPILDGMFINAARIASMMGLRGDLVNFSFGKSENNSRNGTFYFKGEAYTLEQLCTIEQNARLNKDIETLTLLKETLHEVKKELKRILGNYARQARGAKSLLVILISESLQARNIERSILKNWALIKDGEEEQQLERDLIDLCACNTLCIHLIRFLQDLMFSCKKAFSDYRQQVQQQLNSH